MGTRKPSPEGNLYTPQLAGPSRASIRMNQKPFQHRLDEASSSLDLIPTKSNKQNSTVNEILQKQRELTENTLKGASGKYTDLFRTPAREDSTINESDILRESGISVFGQNVHIASTPRISARDSLDVNIRQVAEETRRQSQTLEELIYKLQTSDITISEACREFQERMAQSSLLSNRDMDSDCFVPAELALEQIKADELSWKKENDLPVEHFTEFSQLSINSFKNKVSVGEFFQQRSEDISDVIPNGSPEKTHEPVPLIESSNTSNITKDITNRDSLSVSEIAKLLSENDGNASTVISYLMKCKKTSDKENISPNKKTASISSTSTLPKSSITSIGYQTGGHSEVESDISPRMQNDKTISSLRSGSALSNLPDGKLPIETTRTQLVWGCIKLGRSSTQEFVVRNRSQHRLRIQVTTNKIEFKLLKDRSEAESVNSLKMLLHPLESRTLAVNFCPTAKGAFAGILDFTPIDAELQQSKKQMILLYGYGGHASVSFQNNITKDSSGKYLLPLGDLSDKTSITKTIICQNSGNLSGFVLAIFEPKSVCSSISVSIVPNKFVIKPQQEIAMNVTYSAEKEDFKYFQNNAAGNVFEIGVIKLYTEAEALRGRLKYLANKAKRNNLQVKPIVLELTQTFTYEDFPQDITKLKENIHGMNQLLRQINLREIVVMIEHDCDATIVAIDDTSVFQTLCGDSCIYTTCLDAQ